MSEALDRYPDLPPRAERRRWYKAIAECPIVRDPIDGSILIELPNGAVWTPTLDELAIVVADTLPREAPSQREAVLNRIRTAFTEQEWSQLFEHGLRISGKVATPARPMVPPEGA